MYFNYYYTLLIYFITFIYNNLLRIEMIIYIELSLRIASKANGEFTNSLSNSLLSELLILNYLVMPCIPILL